MVTDVGFPGLQYDTVILGVNMEGVLLRLKHFLKRERECERERERERTCQRHKKRGIYLHDGLVRGKNIVLIVDDSM